jgi:transcriptional regulator with XRE-family HTH domain
VNGIELKVRRIRAGVKGVEIARVAGWSKSKVTKVESRAIVPQADVDAYVAALATFTTNTTGEAA